MHRFVDPEDGECYLYTQYEPADARRVFANFEQPDLKAPFRFEVRPPTAGWCGATAPGGPTDGRRRLGLRADEADLDVHHGGRGRPVPLGDGRLRHVRRRDRWRSRSALCRAGAGAPFDADDVFLVTKQGLDFFHDHFDYPYPFGKYDQAFVPEYNLGAMENPGLVTFREEYIFRGKVTQARVRAPGHTSSCTRWRTCGSATWSPWCGGTTCG